MFYLKQPLYFECTACGACCTGGTDHYIAVNNNEAELIRKHLGVTLNWFRRRYIEHLTRDSWSIRLQDGQCVFLNQQGHCKIYNLRPTQCKTYPYWPELLETKKNWLNERKHCEGINKGQQISIRHIKRQLKTQLDAEDDI